MRGELQAIAEVDSNEDNSQKASGPNDVLSSDGSLSDPKSDANLRSGLGSVGADSPRNGRVNGDAEEGNARASVQELLALVEAERNKMSKAVLSSADGLSSAVTMARKRLAANIAAVEEQLREEKRLLEQARGDQALTVPGASTTELQALLNARDAELETIRREKRAVEDERDELRRDLAATKKELMDSNLRATAAVESAAALQAEVNVLRGNLNGNETFPMPSPVPDLDTQRDAESRAESSATDKKDELQRREDEPVMEGVLRRKKNDHGMFEDAWKQRVMCRLSGGVLEAVAIQDGKTSSEKWEGKFDLNKDWYLPPERRVGGSKVKYDPLRLDLLNKISGEVTSLKAESIEQADMWAMVLLAGREGDTVAASTAATPAGKTAGRRSGGARSERARSPDKGARSSSPGRRAK